MATFGEGLCANTAVAEQQPLPTMLGGCSITVTDLGNVSRKAGLLFVSPGQINWIVPDQTELGAAKLRIETGGGFINATLLVTTVEPGIFMLGKTAPAAYFLRRNTNGTTELDNAYSCDGGTCVPKRYKVPRAGEGRAFLVIFATGVRNHRLPAFAEIGGISTPGIAARQGQFAELDQINYELYDFLVLDGLKTFTLEVDGLTSNLAYIDVVR